MNEDTKEPFTSLGSLIERIGDELAGRTMIAHVLLLECSTAIQAVAQHAAHYERALETLAKNGTHHDLTPTRLVPTDERSGAIDSWWLEYFQHADHTVRTIAVDALRNRTMANRYVDEDELAAALSALGIDNPRGVANQVINFTMRSKIR